MLILIYVFSAHSFTTFVLFWLSLNLLDMCAISPTKSRCSSLHVSFYLIPVFFPCTLFLMTQSSTKRNRNPDIPQPCFIPLSIFFQSDCSLCSSQILRCSHSISLLLLLSLVVHYMIFHKVSRCMLSTAFSKSMKIKIAVLSTLRFVR